MFVLTHAWGGGKGHGTRSSYIRMVLSSCFQRKSWKYEIIRLEKYSVVHTYMLSPILHAKFLIVVLHPLCSSAILHTSSPTTLLHFPHSFYTFSCYGRGVVFLFVSSLCPFQNNYTNTLTNINTFQKTYYCTCLLPIITSCTVLNDTPLLKKTITHSYLWTLRILILQAA